MPENDVTRITLGEMQSTVQYAKNPVFFAGATNKKSKSEHPHTPVARLSVQLMACALVCLIALGIDRLDWPIAQETMAGIKMAVSSDTDLDQAIGKLRFVTNIMDTGDATAVFGQGSGGFKLPLQGETSYVTAAGEYQMHILPPVDSPVVCSAAGRVFYAGESETYGTLIRIVHAGGYESYYTGVTPTVRVGDELGVGDTLGTAQAGQSVRFWITENGKSFNPGVLS